MDVALSLISENNSKERTGSKSWNKNIKNTGWSKTLADYEK